MAPPRSRRDARPRLLFVGTDRRRSAAHLLPQAAGRASRGGPAPGRPLRRARSCSASAPLAGRVTVCGVLAGEALAAPTRARTSSSIPRWGRPSASCRSRPPSRERRRWWPAATAAASGSRAPEAAWSRPTTPGALAAAVRARLDDRALGAAEARRGGGVRAPRADLGRRRRGRGRVRATDGERHGAAPRGAVAAMRRRARLAAGRGSLAAAVALPRLRALHRRRLPLRRRRADPRRNPSHPRPRGAGRASSRYEPARPLLDLTWALNYAVGGDAPVALSPRERPHPRRQRGAPRVALRLDGAAVGAAPSRGGIALLGACLFAASPMAAETVAYVASRSSALAALFVLASLRLAASVLERRAALAPGRVASALFLLAARHQGRGGGASRCCCSCSTTSSSPASAGATSSRAGGSTPSSWSSLPLGLVARRVVTGAWLPPPAMSRGPLPAHPVGGLPALPPARAHPVRPRALPRPPAGVVAADARPSSLWLACAGVGPGRRAAAGVWPERSVAFAVPGSPPASLPSSSLVAAAARWWSTIAPTSAASASPSPSGACCGGSGARASRPLVLALLAARSVSLPVGARRSRARLGGRRAPRARRRPTRWRALGESYAAARRPARGGGLPARGRRAAPEDAPLLGEPRRLLRGARAATRRRRGACGRHPRRTRATRAVHDYLGHAPPGLGP